MSHSQSLTNPYKNNIPADSDTQTHSFIPGTGSHNRAQLHTHTHTRWHTRITRCHIRSLLYVVTQSPQRRLPDHSTLSRSLTAGSSAQPGLTHPRVPRAPKTRPATWPVTSPPRNPSGADRGGDWGARHPELCWGNIQLQGPGRATQLFLSTPRTTSPRRLCAAAFPEGPQGSLSC